VRLVRELLAADVEPAVAQADGSGRAARYLEVVSSGLGLRAAALLVCDPETGGLEAAASTLSPGATAALTEAAGRGAALARRAIDERRALVARRSADDPLVRALHEADPAIETIAILPLVDRAPVGVIVLAGDETTLATEVVRTLNPALRLLSLLVSPHRDGAAREREAEGRSEALRAERDAGTLAIRALEAQVAELEAAFTKARSQTVSPAADERTPLTPERVEEAAAENVRMTAALGAAVAPDAVAATIVVVDTALDWARYPVRDHDVVVTEPSPEGVEQVRAARPARIVLNIAAPGSLAHAVALRAHGVTAPFVGVVAQAGNERVIGLGIVEAVAHPLTAEGLVAAVERAAPRGARVFAAGRDAEALMKMRQTLAKQGLSVSLARDTKQIDELLAMVRPQVVVIDLALPMRQGYELVMRMAATNPVPALVLIAPDGDPGPMLVDKLRDRLAAGMGVGAKQWIVDLSQQKLPSKTVARGKPSGIAAH